jgi:hypothetical protein
VGKPGVHASKPGARDGSTRVIERERASSSHATVSQLPESVRLNCPVRPPHARTSEPSDFLRVRSSTYWLAALSHVEGLHWLRGGMRNLCA